MKFEDRKTTVNMARNKPPKVSKILPPAKISEAVLLEQ